MTTPNLKKFIEQCRALEKGVTEGRWLASRQYGELNFILTEDNGILMSNRSKEEQVKKNFSFIASVRSSQPLAIDLLEIALVALDRIGANLSADYREEAREALNEMERRVGE
jgi:hypothetical protein